MGVLLIVAAGVVLAACGGGDDEESGSVPPSNEGGTITPSETGTTSGESGGGGIEAQAFQVGQEFWHSGFRVEISSGEITSEENALTGDVRSTLMLSASLENIGPDTGFFGPPVTVVTADNSYPMNALNDLPDVPGGLTSQGEFAFRIDPDFDLASASLLVGAGDESQARIPLGGSGDAVRLEPADLPIAGSLSMELVDLNFTSADLRYDVPAGHRQVEAGKRALTLNFDVVSRKGGNWQMFAADFAMVLPDGSAIGADAAEIGSLPGSDDGTTTADRSVRFLVDEMPAGDYTLRLAPGSWFVGDDGVTEATFEFTIDG